MQTSIDQYSVYRQKPPDGFTLKYEESFYHCNDYLISQPEKPRYSYFFCLPEKNQILGKIHFYRRHHMAVSQLYAPFGSFDSGALPKEVLAQFLSYATTSLVSQGVKQIKIYHPASCYQTDPQWGEILLKQGFSIRSIDNHHLVIDENPMEAGLHLMEKRKLAKCKQFEFRTHSVRSLPELYSFISKCRRGRNQSLSMSYERLGTVVNNCPGNFLLCTADYGDQIAAAAIIIKVTSSCWYQFYPAHSQRFHRESPLVFLLSELYKFARHNGVRVLDLGTSEANGVPLPGLLKFKSRLGGVVTHKRVFSKVF